MYRVWLEDVLGFRLRGDLLHICPAIPEDWPGFELTYRHRSAVYEVSVMRDERVGTRVELDGRPLESPMIRLSDDGGKHRVTVRLASSTRPLIQPQQAEEHRSAPRLVI
jgi:cyclic beta-1,2-glucan synthetase